MAETLKSREEQLAALQHELKNLQDERDSIPSFNGESRARVQKEIDKVQDKIDLINQGTQPEAAPEQSKKAELSVGDMMKLVVEYNALKKAQSELNPAHSDRKRIQVELDAIGRELKENNVDPENKLMMALIEVNQKLVKENEELKSGQPNPGDEELTEPEVEDIPEKTADPAEADYRAKSIAATNLLTNLDIVLGSANEAEANKIIAQLESMVVEMAKIIGQIKNAETKQKYQERWEKKGVASKVEEAKKKLAPETDAANAEGVAEAEEGAAIEDVSGRLKDAMAKEDVQEIRRLIGGTRQFVDYGKNKLGSMGDGDERTKLEAAITAAESLITEAERMALELDDKAAGESDKEQSAPRLAKIFKGIRNKFTGIVGWFNRNAGSRAESSPTRPESITDVEADKERVISDEDRARETFEIQKKSILNINEKIKDILKKRAEGKSEPEDAAEFAFALDSLYTAEDIVNREATSLSKEQQDELKALIYVIGERLEGVFGKGYADLMDDMDEDIGSEEGKLEEERGKRMDWFTELFNGKEEGESVTQPAVETVATSTEAPGIEDIKI